MKHTDRTFALRAPTRACMPADTLLTHLNQFHHSDGSGGKWPTSSLDTHFNEVWPSPWPHVNISCSDMLNTCDSVSRGTRACRMSHALACARCTPATGGHRTQRAADAGDSYFPLYDSLIASNSLAVHKRSDWEAAGTSSPRHILK